MNRFESLLPRTILIIAGVAVGLLARQVLGPPDEDDRLQLTIDRPIGESVELGPEQAGYVPVDLPIAKLPAAELPAVELPAVDLPVEKQEP